MRAYWRDSRAPRYSLLFALPLFLLYQVLAAMAPADPGGGLRNGADVILQTLFVRIAGSRGPLLFLVCLVVAGLWLVLRDIRSHERDLRPGVFALMLVEASLLAVVFGTVVSLITSQIMHVTATLRPAQLAQLGPGTRVMLSLGAGLYEELLFRVLLVGGLAWTGRALLGFRPLVAGLWAALLGALVFAAFHYIGPYGDRWEPYSFVFRTIAGLALSALFLLRGFGITAWTHALYDLLLLLR
ncbi:MAG TPA: CPBP family intramembrane glutamic endopeptidase [Gemmatimonadales bacterium]|nr:CPBP family intramembrane glutamic endopeptidase [Gemmatimonadales bacterium]